MPTASSATSRPGASGGEDALRLHARLREAFTQAAGGQPIERRIAIADTPIRLLFAGEPLVEAVHPALSHLETGQAAGSALTVRLWDSASSGVPSPSLPWRPTDVTPRGGIRGHHDPRFRMRHDPVAGLVAVYDESSREAVLWFPDADHIPWSERSSPFRELAGWSLAGPRVPLVHAAAVGGGEGGALLTGPGGSGKSVIALAALAAGLEYAGDDHVLVSLDPEPVAHSLCSLARVHERDLDRIPVRRAAMVGWLEAPYAAKAVVDARKVRSGAVARQVELSAIVIPQMTAGDRARLRRVNGAEALRWLAPSTVFLLPQEPGAVMAAMGELVKRLPAYALELTGNPAHAAREIEALCGGS